MKVALRYLGRSALVREAGAAKVQLAPNLARERVAFDAELRDPIRFREAMSALHEVVVGDFRFKKRDKSAYLAWKQQKNTEEQALRKVFYDQAKRDEVAKRGKTAPPPGLDDEFRKMHRLYWDARVRWANELSRNDPELFRHLVPCDPVISVAPDVVFFEGFAKDESSYGCVYVDRDAFAGHQDAELGTTNVDYSIALYEHFQTLRTYRSTRLGVDPKGFDVKVEGQDEVREEKIDLPPSWLRGFGQISAATSLSAHHVRLPVEVMYSVLAHLERHREKTGPRSVRFQLTPGKAPVIVLDPWGIEVPVRGRAWDGERPIEIKVWGRRRLRVLHRVLPLAEHVDVHLLGSGLPSIWVADLGAMRFVLALSGWTTNDFASGTNLELLAGHFAADQGVIDRATRVLRTHRKASLTDLSRQAEASRGELLAAMHHLAKRGQVIFDFASQSFRWRQVLPVELGESLLGPEPEELVRGRELFASGKLVIEREEALDRGRRLLVARVERLSCEAIVDGDGAMARARCPCHHHRRFALRKGPCRHLLALRLTAQGKVRALVDADLEARFNRNVH